MVLIYEGSSVADRFAKAVEDAPEAAFERGDEGEGILPSVTFVDYHIESKLRCKRELIGENPCLGFTECCIPLYGGFTKALRFGKQAAR